jgi:phosphatidyl-myo-inositol dimannoside synthase
LRVLALITEAFGGAGGIAQYNRDFLSALSQSRRIEEVLALPRFGRAPEGKLPGKVSQLEPAESKASYVLSACQTALKGASYGLIFCGHIHTAPLAFYIGRCLKAPVWLQAHGIDAFDKPAPHIRYAAERAAMITAVSRYTRSRFLRWANVSPFRVRVLPNTVRSLFQPGPASAAHLERFDLPPGKIVLTLSRISKREHYKGHANVIEALPAVLLRHPDAIYAVAGDGDGRGELEKLVAQLGLERNVCFLGHVSEDEVLALYRTARVFIMPSHKEGFGIVFAEAAAAGLAVIGGNRDGSADALADGEIGRMIDPHSQHEIVSALIGALDGSAFTGSVSADRFSFSHFAGHVDELLQVISR